MNIINEGMITFVDGKQYISESEDVPGTCVGCDLNGRCTKQMEPLFFCYVHGAIWKLKDKGVVVPSNIENKPEKIFTPDLMPTHGVDSNGNKWTKAKYNYGPCTVCGIFETAD